MEKNKLNQEMDKTLADTTAALHAHDDETGDGSISLPDLKLQLDRVEAQLELQDQQNRTLLRNQKLRFMLTVVVVIVLCVVVGVLWYHTTVAYNNILDTCTQVSEIATTMQNSLDKLDTEQLDTIVAELPALVDKLSGVDVDALNDVLTRMPTLMDGIAQLQTQFSNLSTAFGNLGSLFGQ